MKGVQYIKQVVCSLEKCYALSTLMFGGEEHLLVAAEKHAPCYLLGSDGTVVDTVWEEPGGVMTMVPVPGREGTFLATHQFYSPNDAKNAKLICAEFCAAGSWRITTIAELPFVHRFDIIEKNGVCYVLACTLKSGHEYKNDWRFPGKLWAGVLGEDPSEPLELAVIKDGLSFNHGYTRYVENGVVSGIVSSEQGVFRVTPPAKSGGEWQIEQLLDQFCSDAVLTDLDGDGVPELFTISPFHGNMIRIWHQNEGGAYEQVYTYPEELPFLHAICNGTVYGLPAVFVGNREGDRLLLCFTWKNGAYSAEIVDSGCGPANCLLFEREGKPVLLASNREVSEVALYEIEP